MKRVTASEARRRWFELLDEILAGEEVVIERGGGRVVLRRDRVESDDDIPDYCDLIRVSDVDHADRWGWEWTPESELAPTPPDDPPPS